MQCRTWNAMEIIFFQLQKNMTLNAIQLYWLKTINMNMNHLVNSTYFLYIIIKQKINLYLTKSTQEQWIKNNHYQHFCSKNKKRKTSSLYIIKYVKDRSFSGHVCWITIILIWCRYWGIETPLPFVTEICSWRYQTNIATN